MPIQRCKENGKPGFKWGEQGKCYTYDPSSESSAGKAKQKAALQAVAMGEGDKLKNE